MSDTDEIHPLTSPKLVEKFLKKNSRHHNSVISVSELARGGEAIVYRVENTTLDEIVAKCTIFQEGADHE
jgi:hypothetical protein